MENETRQCPFCGEEILAVAKKCKYCGEFLEETPAKQYADKNQTRTLPLELQKFNWGAFLFSWIWGIGNKSYLTFWIFASIIPFIGWIAALPLCIWFGIKGNEWAWNNNQWNSIEDFNNTQQIWVKVWFGLFGIGMCFYIILGAVIASSY